MQSTAEQYETCNTLVLLVLCLTLFLGGVRASLSGMKQNIYMAKRTE